MLWRILIVAAVTLFILFWIRTVIDVFKRSDLSTAAKAAWAIIMLILPFIGIAVYILVRPSEAQIARRSAR